MANAIKDANAARNDVNDDRRVTVKCVEVDRRKASRMRPVAGSRRTRTVIDYRVLQAKLA